MDWPDAPGVGRPLITISTLSLLAKGADAHFVAPNSATWPAANRAIFVPFRTAVPILVRQLFNCNGATASGNIDVGIYDRVGTRLVSAGSTAQAGTSVLQVFNVTDTLIGPGQFYFAVALDNTTGTITRQAPPNVLQTRALGLVQMASAFPLPATATFATVANVHIPLCGLTTKTVV